MPSVASVASVEFARVSFAHSDALPLIRDLSLRIEPGWTGVVGPNGAGKSTLLQLASGQLQPDAGRVLHHPPEPRVRLCPQTVEVAGADVRALAEAEDGGGRRLRERLGLDPEGLRRWESLSPGERKRWQVGAALHADPAVLLLDEPTNHLDGAAREQLSAALRDFRGVGLLVSHDRALLDALTQRTLRFHLGALRAFRGGYSQAREEWEREARREADAYRRLQSDKRKLRRRAQDAQEKREQATSRMRKRMRRAPIEDIDTRKQYSMTRRRSAEARYSGEARKSRDQLERLEAASRSGAHLKQLGRALFVDWQAPRTRHLGELETARLCAGGRELLRDVRLRLDRDSRIQLCGPNGSGKTTLSLALLRCIRLPASGVLHLPQELEPGDGAARVRELREAHPERAARVLGILAALGVEPDAVLASARPSPGETRKLALALGLADRAALLVLDEPTNHLDLPSIERLEAALAAYPGALLLVTHDEVFARHLTDTVWELADGRVQTRSR